MRFAAFVFAWVAAATPLAAQAAARVAIPLPASDLAALEAIRKDVWVRWYSGDTAALRRVLGPELVAMGPGAVHWQSLDETLASAVRFRASGGRFVSVAFDSTVNHRFGEVVVMFSRYTVVSEHAGTRETQSGRATEVFVRANGQWVHTSWHLDQDDHR